MSMKHTYEEVKDFIESLGYELISKEYINNSTILILKDKDGYLYNSTLKRLFKNKTPEKFHKSNTYSIQNIKLWCKLNNKHFELLNDKYEDSKVKMKWKCFKLECGEVFKANWHDILTGSGCGICAGMQVCLSNCLATKRPDIAKEWHPILNGDLTPYDVTINSGKQVWWQCNKNPKHNWLAFVSDRNVGSGCPYCSGYYASEDYNLLVINPKLCEEWDYEKNKKKPEEYTPGTKKYVCWKCRDCGHKWSSGINHRNNGSGCPECNKSKGEKKIDEVLINKNWIKISQEDFEKLIDEDKYNMNYFIPQKEFDRLIGLRNGNLSYDYYIPKYNLLIEYQGEQHEKYIPGFHKSIKDFERQVEHDRRKREYTSINNINLLEIWYYDFDRIEEILEKELSKLSLKEVI